jgi:FMN phosphatase YigB (HAD superfamily)
MLVRDFSKTTNFVDKRKTNADWTPMPKRQHGSAKLKQRTTVVLSLLVAICLTHSVCGFPCVPLSSKQRVKLTTCKAMSPKTTGSQRTLGLLTFDLDDTLFPISEVVRDSNEKMVSYLQSSGYETSVADFLETTREVRRILEKPVTYKALRKLAIEAEMKRVATSNKSRIELAPFVDEGYQVWENERHAAAERYLFPETIPVLETIKQQYPDACIAAVTNGKGNPLHMDRTLKKYFEFCVSGEDENVFPNRKPHAGIYEVTTARYRELYPHHTDESHIWCHVGDCLANDVGGSAACGAFAIWYAPEPTEGPSALHADGKQPNSSYSTATQHDVQQRATQAQAAQELVATRIRNLKELSDAIAMLSVSLVKLQPYG